MNWSADELRRIVEADDLKIAPFREDGATYGTPTWIWYVAPWIASSKCAPTTSRSLGGTKPRCGSRRTRCVPLVRNRQ